MYSACSFDYFGSLKWHCFNIGVNGHFCILFFQDGQVKKWACPMLSDRHLLYPFHSLLWQLPPEAPQGIYTHTHTVPTRYIHTHTVPTRYIHTRSSPAHTARSTTTWFDAHAFTVLDWPLWPANSLWKPRFFLMLASFC